MNFNALFFEPINETELFFYLSGGGKAKEPAMQNMTTTADEVHFMSPATGEEESLGFCPTCTLY
jgi:hypothetical protein